MLTLVLPIRGSSFRPQPSTNDLIKHALSGEPCVVDLEPENDNQYDANAVQILIDGAHVGYIPKERAAEVREFIREEQLTSCRLSPPWSIELTLDFSDLAGEQQ